MKDKIRIVGGTEDPKVQKGMLVNLFTEIQRDLMIQWLEKQTARPMVFNFQEFHNDLKKYLMNLYDEVCPEERAPFTKAFYEKTFDIWWENGIEKALASNY